MKSQKHLFSLDPDVHYLNCAYMSPMLKSVEEAGIEGIKSKRNPFHIFPDDFFRHSNEVRQEFARLIQADNPNRISLVSSASYGLSNVARNIAVKKGDEILVTEGQFPSNYYIWDRIAGEKGAKMVMVEAPESSPKGQEWNQRILDAINPSTRVVALPHVHWADGIVFNLKSIREKTREMDALLIIDGTQSVGALPFYIPEIQPDALVCAAYKWLMGPYSIGMAYMGEYFDNGLPIEENWISRRDSDDFAGLVNYKDDYQPGAMRYDVGERSNFILVPMALAALRQINSWGVENIIQYCDELVKPSLKRLEQQGYLVEEENYRSSHLFGIRKKNFDPGAFSKLLSENRVFVSVRGDAVRVSVNVFNEKEDILAFERVCLEV